MKQIKRREMLKVAAAVATGVTANRSQTVLAQTGGVASASAFTVIENAPEYPADATTVIQAGLDAVNPNRGGDVFLARGRYKLTSGLASTRQGLNFSGEGMPGVDKATCRGSTEIVVADGHTGLSLGLLANHQTRGYGLRSLHIIADGPRADGTGILVLNAEQDIFQDLSISDFTSGIGLLINGGTYMVGTNVGGNAQYIEARNLRIANCEVGLKLVGPASIRLSGGYFAGHPPDLSRIGTGILVEGGEIDVSGTRFQGWDTAINVRRNSGHEIKARFENNNIAVRIGSQCNGVCIRGGFTSSNIGVFVEAGARNIKFEPTYLSPDVKRPWVVEQPASDIQIVYPGF